MSSSHQNRPSLFSISGIPSTSSTTMGSDTNSSITSSNTNSTLSNISQSTTEKPTVVLQGYLKKLKTMKKKYFILKRDSKEGAARLEYYDNEKKFKSRSSQPKRKIYLKDTRIIRRLDTKHKYVIAFHNKDDSFCIVLESEKDLNTWLRTCIAIQKGEEVTEDASKQTFEHVWQVHVQRKGLAEEKGIIGNYNVCLTEKALSLIRIGAPLTLAGEPRMASVEFFLMTIRRCGNTQIYFYLEVGRHSAVGSGELWMETEDALIAENMHTLIFNAMSESSKSREEFMAPISRNRSSSATESSKPIPVNDKRRLMHTGNKTLNTSLSPTGEKPPVSTSYSSATTSTNTVVQCTINIKNQDNQTSTHITQTDINQPVLSASNCTTITTIITPAITSTSCNPQYPSTAPLRPLGSQRRHSVSVATTTCHQRAYSLPSGPITFANLNISGTQNLNLSANNQQNNMINNHVNTIQPVHQRTRSLPLTEETAIQLTSSANHLTSVTSTSSSITAKCSCYLLNKIHNNCTLHNKSSQYTSSKSNYNNNINCNNNYNNNNNNELNNINHREHNMLYNKSTISTGKLDSTHNITNSMDSIIEDQVQDQSDEQQHFNIINRMLRNTNSEDNTFSMLRQLTKPSNIGNKSSSVTSPLTLRRCRNSNASWSTISRDRCDSLPSRNSVTSESSNHSLHSSIMPPPRSILSNRPHSMYLNRFSHSPPVNSSPLSPSGACSESDGSSISIDETDGMMHPEDRLMRFLNSGTVIPEENAEECVYTENSRYSGLSKNGKNSASLSLPISQSQSFGQRKGSPALKSGSVDVGSYMEMYSPCGCSPGDPSGGAYIPMSPGMYTGSSGAHSRASSLAEETIEGYVPMCPQQSEEYVDMDPPNRHSHHHHHHATTNSMSSAASSCSITSGTPSTDMRFAEYHLDKVSARFTPDDEDTSSLTERPIRAYSVGSRLEHNKRKYRVDILNAELMSSRVRAYSVGSRAKVPRSDLYRGVLTPSQAATINAQENIIQNTNSHSTKGKKSSSAPILNIKGHSVDPMDDLMEIDYSRKDENCATPVSNDFSQNEDEIKPTDLMEIDFSDNQTIRNTITPMRSSLPVPVPNARRYDKSEISPKLMNNHFSEYVEMKPQLFSSDPLAISNKKEDCGYLNMKPVGVSSLSKSPSLSCSPIKSMSSPKTVPLTSTSFSSSLNKSSNYMDLSSRSLDKIQNLSHDDKTISGSPKTTSDDYLNMRPVDILSNHKTMELPKTVSAPEGYIEMSWGKESRNLNNNTITEKPSSDEYINMNFGRSPESRLTSSLPIAIQNRNRNSFNGPIISTPKIQPTIYSTFSNTANNSTSPGKTTRVRCESKDSGIVTPSGSQAAIFPFSPSSPIKNIDAMDINALPRKCLVDGSTGTIRLSEEDEQEESSPIDETKMLNVDLLPTPTQVDNLSSNYADMSIDSGQRKQMTTPLGSTLKCPDYVNCAPSNTKISKPISTSSTLQKEDESGDYAFVDPTKKVNVSTNIPGLLPLKKSLITINNNQDKLYPFGSFKPISSNTDELLLRNTNYISKAGSPKPVVTSALNRHLTEKRSSDETKDSSFDILQIRIDNKKLISSRPNSVNSEKISTKNSNSSSSLNRPNSANSDRLPHISASSSSSTLCGSSSTSSTLCGSKSQSPSTSSTRPQSLGDIGSTNSCITSRPESVTSIPDSHIISSRPPSVSSERELHYASLDLPPPTNRQDSDEISCKGSSTPAYSSSNMATCDSSSASPSPNTSGSSTQPQPSAFTYAQIDFVKSEHLKTKQLTK